MTGFKISHWMFIPTKKFFFLGLLAGVVSMLNWKIGVPAVFAGEAVGIAMEALVWSMLAMAAIAIAMLMKFDSWEGAGSVVLAWICAAVLVGGLITTSPYAMSLAITGFAGVVGIAATTTLSALGSAPHDCKESVIEITTLGAGAMLLPALTQLQII